MRAAQLLLERGDIRRLEPKQEDAVEVNEDRVRALLMRLPLALLWEVLAARG